MMYVVEERTIAFLSNTRVLSGSQSGQEGGGSESGRSPNSRTVSLKRDSIFGTPHTDYERSDWPKLRRENRL